MRDLNEHSKTILTTPPGSVNFSNTSSALLKSLAADFPLSAVTGIPVPLATAATYVAKRMKANALSKKVQSALNPLAD